MIDATESLGKIAQSTSIIFAGTLVAQILGLLAEIIIVRSLPPEIYGMLALAYTIVVLTGKLSVLGVGTTVTRLSSAHETFEEQKKIIQHGFLIVLISGTLFSAVLFGLRSIIPSFLNKPKLFGYLILFLPVTVLYPISSVAYGVLRAEGRSFAATISYYLARRLIPLLALIGAILIGAPQLGAVLYWVGLPLVMIIFAMWFLRTSFVPWDLFRIPDKDTLRELLAFSLPLALSSFIFIFLSRLDILLIAYFMDEAAVGYYRSIQPLQMAATFLTGAFSFFYLPMATRHYEEGDLEGLKTIYQTSTKWLLFGTFPVVLVLGLFASDIVRVFFGNSYAPAAPALSILMFGLLFRTVVGLNGDMIRAVDRTNVEAVTAFAGLVVNFSLNVLLIPRYGISGAALATVVAYFSYNALEVLSVYRASGAHPFHANNFKPLVVALAVGLVIKGFTTEIVLNLEHLVGIGLLVLVVQVSAVFVTKSFSSNDLAVVEQVEETTNIELAWIKSLIGE